MRSSWLKIALTAVMGVVMMLVMMLFPSSAHAASSPLPAAPLCDFRGASAMVLASEAVSSSSVAAPSGTEAGSTGSNMVAALCDMRGATMIAPAPLLQMEGTWLTLTPGTDALSQLMAARSLVPGHDDHQVSFELQMPDPSLIAIVPSVVPAAQVARVSCPVVAVSAHPGVQGSLDRPPRA